MIPYVLKNIKTGEYFFLKRFTITSTGEIISNSNPFKKTEMKLFSGKSWPYCRENFLIVTFVYNHENSANNKYRTTAQTNTHGKLGAKTPWLFMHIDIIDTIIAPKNNRRIIAKNAAIFPLPPIDRNYFSARSLFSSAMKVSISLNWR